MRIGLMRKQFIVFICLLIGVAANADENRIKNVNVRCALDSLGAAHITEVWDVHTARGTEWYLVRENLGDIEIKDLKVSEGHVEFTNEGRWDTERSISQKSLRCGLHPTPRGYEICWGIGSYDEHVFTVSYTMTNAVKSLDDYDMLHVQFISDGLSSYVEHASVSVSVPGAQLDTLNSRIWAFGYEGYIYFDKGEVVAEPEYGLGDDDSVIILLRLDKGVIASPQSRQEGQFQSHLDWALEGAHFDDDDQGSKWYQKLFAGIVVFFVVMFYGGWILLILPILLIDRIISRKKYLGTYFRKEVPWSREIPFGGDIVTANFALSEFSEEGNNNAVASAMILQMVKVGAIKVRKGQDDSVELAFGEESAMEGLDQSTRELWEMMKEASGKDHILQDKEFSTWSKSHKGKVSKWVDNVEKHGKKEFRSGVWCTNNQVNPTGVAECRKAYGLKKFLKDFTLLKERASFQTVLWTDYLIFAALFGIAEKVAQELSDINPEYYKEMQSSDPIALRQVLHTSNGLATAITKAKSDHEASKRSSSRGGGGGVGSSRGGYGGHSSHSGGRGFSGGGRGGGSR